jgi:hypothetical protein
VTATEGGTASFRRLIEGSDRQLLVYSVEKLPFQKSPENGSVLAEFCSSTCGNRTLAAYFSGIKLSR